MEFHEGVHRPRTTSGRLADADALGDAPLSLYVHLPFCEERCLFCGCHVIVTQHKAMRPRRTSSCSKREIEMLAERLPEPASRRAAASRRRYADLLHAAATHRSPHAAARGTSGRSPGAELALEADPRVTTTAHLDALADLGFNRISLGVQDLTPAVQQAVEPRAEPGADCGTDPARAEARFPRHQRGSHLWTSAADAGDLRAHDRVGDRRSGADRAAVYSFAFVPWVRGSQKKLEADQLPDPETKIALFAIARERFLRAGYDADRHGPLRAARRRAARAPGEGRLRRNFQGYAVIPGDDVLGLGISAIGDVRGAYVQNEKKLSTYEAIDHDGHAAGGTGRRSAAPTTKSGAR